MKRVLADSQAVIVARQGGLPARARATLEAAPEPLLVSVATLWEIAIKRRKGRIPIGPGLSRELEASGVELLAIAPRHAEHVADLPDHHGDPFDRLLIAQALLEDLVVVTGDPMFARYGVETVW